MIESRREAESFNLRANLALMDDILDKSYEYLQTAW